MNQKLKPTVQRKEMSDDEMNIYKNSVSSSIRKDFLKSNVSYQNKSELQCLAGYKRLTKDALKEVGHILEKEFCASMADVGHGKIAIVKRPDSGNQKD